LEGTYNDHQVQLPDRFKAEQKLKHVVKTSSHFSNSEKGNADQRTTKWNLRNKDRVNLGFAWQLL